MECYKQCPYRYKLQYIDHLKTIPDQSPSNALYLGIGVHKGIETTPQEGVSEYYNQYYLLNDEIISWGIQIEYWTERVKTLLPENGTHEHKIEIDDFIGYIDYLTSDTIFDFKFTVPKNFEKYLESKQLHIYKYFLEKQLPNVDIKHLKYIFIPKCSIRQKKTETIYQFRERLYSELDKLSVEIREIPYNENSITQFLEERKQMESDTEYHKNKTGLCNWCNYKKHCLEGINYELTKKRKEETENK